MEIKGFAIGLGILGAVGLFAGVGLTASQDGDGSVTVSAPPQTKSKAGTVAKTKKKPGTPGLLPTEHTEPPVVARSIYYPGYLSQYPYARGSFVYAESPATVQPGMSTVPATVIPDPYSAQTVLPTSFSAQAIALPTAAASLVANRRAVMSPDALSGFSVHVGSFLDHAKADTLEERLRNQELPSFRLAVAYNGVPYVQLHVGLFQERAEADVAVSVMETMNIPGVLLFHEVIASPW